MSDVAAQLTTLANDYRKAGQVVSDFRERYGRVLGDSLQELSEAIIEEARAGIQAEALRVQKEAFGREVEARENR
jgi:hypothetical protein